MKSTRVQIHPRKSTDGFKTEGHWLAEALGATWSRRRGYTVASAKRAEEFRLLSAAGIEASRRWFNHDKTPYTFSRPGLHEKLTLKEALLAAKGSAQ